MSLAPLNKTKDLQRLRFITHTPLAIKDLKYNENNNLILCARENGVISVLDTKRDFTVRSLYFAQDGSQISSLCWHPKGELFYSGGDDSMITIWSLKQQNPLGSFKSYGAAINSMVCTADGSVLAVASDDGTVRIFLIDENNLIYQGSTEDAGKAVTSLAAHPSDKIIAVGTAGGFVNIVDISQKPWKTISKCHVEGSKRNPSIVWTISFINEKHLVTGSSRGTVSFYNLEGNKEAEFKKHEADILCTAVAGSKVYASGMDPLVAEFRTGKDIIFTRGNRSTTHDLSAMCVCSVTTELKLNSKKKNKRTIDVIVAGGIDGHLNFFRVQDFASLNKNYTRATTIHCLPTPPTDSKAGRVISTRGLDAVEIWDLPKIEGELPRCAMRMKSNAFRQLLSVAMGRSGYFAVSTSAGARIYQLSEKSEILRVVVDIEDSLLPPCSVVKFFTVCGVEHLLGATLDGVIFLANQVDDAFKIKMVVKATDSMPLHVAMSSDGLYISVTDAAGKVNILSTDLEGPIPSQKQLSVDSNIDISATAFTDHILLILNQHFNLRHFNVDDGKFTDFDAKFCKLHNYPAEIFFEWPKSPHDLVVLDDSTVALVSSSTVFTFDLDSGAYKQPKLSSENIIGLHRGDDESVILIENTHVAQKQLLPPSIYTHKFGSG